MPRQARSRYHPPPTRMPRRRPLKFLFAALLVLPACQGAPPASAATPLACTLVLLKTGSVKPSQEEAVKVFAGHFANMQRLAREGHLLVAGPYGKQKSDPELRGVFVLATGERAEAKALAETDPGFQASVFQLEYHDLVTTAPLRENLAAVLAAEDAAKAAGKPSKPGDAIRPYVVLNAANGAAAEVALKGLPDVLMVARLDGDRVWALLAANDLSAAQQQLRTVRDQLGTHTLDEWYSSAALADLPKLAH